MVMLNEGTSAPAGAADGLIKDTTTQAFMKDVIEESRRQPVLVDFWAPWCGPCKQLTPIIEKVIRAAKGKAIIVLNPAEPPLIMRDTVYTLSELADEAAIEASIEHMVQAVRAYVPGYRLKQRVQFDRITSENPLRIPGVGDAALFGGGDYAMRLWLDPDAIAARGLSAGDVLRAVREQNVQVSAGQLGAEPMPNGSDFLVSINAQGRLQTQEEFGQIVIESGRAGEIVRLADVARLELGAGDYTLAAARGRVAAGVRCRRSAHAGICRRSRRLVGRAMVESRRF